MKLKKYSIISCSRRLFCVTLLGIGACSQSFTVSVNDNATYDPAGRLIDADAIDADLQGCINLAQRQQDLSDPTQLTVLSCANSEIQNLANIGQLERLRFLDLSNNSISNLTPLEGLLQLSGLNLANNQISNISPLFNMPGLTSVSLQGNDQIPCSQLQRLSRRMGNNLLMPDSCRN